MSEFVHSNGKVYGQRCFICDRLPHQWEDGFAVYGKPICEECFWDADDWESKLEAQGYVKRALVSPVHRSNSISAKFRRVFWYWYHRTFTKEWR